MADPNPQQEPSMEEILASIRRIISEDGEPGEAGGEGQASDDVLELTDIVEDEPAAEAAPAEAEPPEPAPVAEAAEPEPEPEPPPEEEPSEPEAELPGPPADDGLPREHDEIELREEDRTPPPAPPAPPAAPGGGLLSDAAAAAAGNSLSNLVAAVDRAHAGTPVGQGGRTIEDLVKEVMRPIIKEWLDSNLPGLVERIVEREVARLGRRAEGED